MHRVRFQIGFGDQAAVRRHVLGQQARGLAFVEILGAELLDALERARQLGLDEEFAGLVEFAVLQEDAIGFRETRRGRACRAAIAASA